jgi:hypothetical protein
MNSKKISSYWIFTRTVGSGKIKKIMKKLLYVVAAVTLLLFFLFFSLIVQRQYWNLVFNNNWRINRNMKMVFMNTILILPVMVSGLGMRPGRHLQIGLPSLHKTVPHQSFSCELQYNFLLFSSVFSGSVTFWYGSGCGSSDPYHTSD